MLRLSGGQPLDDAQLEPVMAFDGEPQGLNVPDRPTAEMLSLSRDADHLDQGLRREASAARMIRPAGVRQTLVGDDRGADRPRPGSRQVHSRPRRDAHGLAGPQRRVTGSRPESWEVSAPGRALLVLCWAVRLSAPCSTCRPRWGRPTAAPP